MQTTASQAELDERELQRLRFNWGDVYAVVIEDGSWTAHPSYGPSRAPITADTSAALELMMSQNYSKLPRGNGSMST